MDAPLPENLPVVGACWPCNNGFSSDEEYVACLLESVITGTTNPEDMRRPSIANILKRSPSLRGRLEAANRSVEGRTEFAVEDGRIQNVVVKLARGHAAYELSQPCRDAPASCWWQPLELMEEAQRGEFESDHVIGILGEAGSRGVQRALVVQVTLRSENGDLCSLSLLVNGWVDVQEGRYRYHAIHDENGIKIKLVIGEYLACEVVWEWA